MNLKKHEKLGLIAMQMIACEIRFFLNVHKNQFRTLQLLMLKFR